ncbi:MAG TPA: peptidoglycan-associated lipoprotein Pal [Candidatus Krumholzibacteria bacterium]|nr:peptidoglycan-associated lipoprotein Pal [Candidatus Krumholzibacteria bacterium]HPD71680.1 peptidoglycan-associated lipoprotein Pal [Candidatus Krumholzibacteria bacterium]HRY41387.1 peptidoglycan-associated lipoprotein Pal [Candidatus Krumholzibacteria bacterium]
MKGTGMNVRQLPVIVGLLVVAVALLLAAGCGGDKPAPETDADTMGTGQPVETVPEPVTPEAPAQPVPARDYAAMDPAEYGVEDVFFAYDKYDLDDVAMATLAQNARIFNEHPDVAVLIEGHCDERGTVEYNLALGEKRAKAVRDYLVSLGMGSSRVRVTSYGESRPFALGSDEAAWAKNRRAHFARP